MRGASKNNDRRNTHFGLVRKFATRSQLVVVVAEMDVAERRLDKAVSIVKVEITFSFAAGVWSHDEGEILLSKLRRCVG